MTAILSALISGGLLAAGLKRWGGRIGRRYRIAAGVATGFSVGYLLLPDWAVWLPERHWHWMPYLIAAAAILGGAGAARGVRSIDRALLALVAAGMAAAALTPSWNDLQPSRAVLLPLIAAYLVSLAWLYVPLCVVLPVRTVLGHWILAQAVLTVLIAYFFSLRYAQLAAVSCAAAGGCWAAIFWGAGARAVRGAVPTLIVAAGGVAFVAAVEPTPFAWPLLLAPAAPLTLWLFVRGPLARLPAKPRVAAQAMATVLTLGGLAIVIYVRQMTG